MLLHNFKSLKIFKKNIEFLTLQKQFKILANNVQISIKKKIQNFFFFILKKSSFWSFSEIIDIITIDKNSNNNRFLLNYCLLSEKYNYRLIVKIRTKGLVLIESLSKIYKGTTWLEREVFDMFGIFFKQNKDLRRILTDYGFDGFPLRKDFPICGFFEKYYSIAENIIFKNKISLIQEFRFEQKKN